MQANQDRALDILARLGSHPATAFYEAGVAGEVKAVLAESGVEWSTDGYGNVIALVPGREPASKDLPPVAFVAHMDHPGFEAVTREGDYLVGKAAGGVPAGSFGLGNTASGSDFVWRTVGGSHRRSSWRTLGKAGFDSAGRSPAGRGRAALFRSSSTWWTLPWTRE